jgi:tetratricopeptide (TPR) repeat protein
LGVSLKQCLLRVRALGATGALGALACSVCLASDAPSVTQAEAGLVERVGAVAATNQVRAIAMARSAAGPDASAALDFTLANLLFHARQWDEAMEAYRAALRKMPEFRAARVNLAKAAILQGQPEEAVQACRQLLRTAHADADVLLLLGQALLGTGDAVSAEAAFRQALLYGAGASEARQGLARALLLQGRDDESAALLGEMLRDEPTRLEWWRLRAHALLQAGRRHDAAQALETARRLGGVDGAMLAALADLHLDAGQPDAAVARYRDAREHGALSPPHLLRAAEGLILTGDTGRAAELLSEAAAWEERDPAAWDGEPRRQRQRIAAELALADGRFEEAVGILRTLLRQDPLDGRSLLKLGDLLREQGRPEDAMLAFERAARVAGLEADGLVRQAQVEVERGRYSRAVELLESAQAFRDQPHVSRYLRQVRRLADTSSAAKGQEAP